MFDKIRERLRFEKEVLNGIRYKYNCVFVPMMSLFIIIDLLITLIVFLSWRPSYFVLAIVLLSLLIAALVSIFIVGIVVKKKEIPIEAEKLDNFFKANLLVNPEHEYVLPRSDALGVVSLSFHDKGFKIEDLEYSYESFEYALYTSNYMNQVNLIIMFTRNEVGDEEDGDNKGVVKFSLPLDINLLSILNKYNIVIKNPDVLKFIKENSLIAAKQILKYGKIQNNYYDAK